MNSRLLVSFLATCRGLLVAVVASLSIVSALAADQTAAPHGVEPAKKKSEAVSMTDIEKPAPTAIEHGAPVGLYFMTRFWPAIGSLEKSVWYFAPGGMVYEGLQHGFSADDLGAHRGKKGTFQAEGESLAVAWSDGKKTKSKFTPSGKGFSWNGGIFTAVKPFDGSVLAGSYEGGESLSGAAGRAMISKRLELRADGTFTWSGVSFLGATTQDSTVSAAAAGAGTAGTWKTSSYSIVMADESGSVFRRIAFPYDDEKTAIKPDYIFLGGILYKKQP